jgi:hypothetical protein
MEKEEFPEMLVLHSTVARQATVSGESFIPHIVLNFSVKTLFY